MSYLRLGIPIMRTFYKAPVVKSGGIINMISKTSINKMPFATMSRSYHERPLRTTSSVTAQLKLLMQKRNATHSQLGRQTWGQPKYNNSTNNIVKPLIFVTLFSLVTYFAMPFVFEYTPLSYFKKNPHHFIWSIIGLNAAVFGLWFLRYQNAKLYRVLEKYFIMDRSALNRTNNWSMLLSTFSHQEPFHFLVNMGCLYSFSGTMISVLGVPGFASLYLIAGAWSSMASLAYAQGFKYFGRSLGASGAIAGIFTCFATLFPTAGISFFFLPIPGGAVTAAGLFAGYNVAGCLLKWGSFDYAAHLGGMLIGLFWAFAIKAKLEKEEQERRNRLRKFGF